MSPSKFNWCGKLSEALRCNSMFLALPIQLLTLVGNVVSVSLEYFQQHVLTFEIGKTLLAGLLS
ncbi:hypothetical protein BST63_00780 [Bradyrhizobium canariense]|uniref:Uncharacterized protein n=1 Tax=Bradyrhizobium canariense TaxID=255045 RepID=A0ABX3XCJ0_9BRAD|nr:hypothetical protein BSR47_00675 [Bradyrhizobium canariense]OSJ36374.1 hypothetical protein BST63_00780 [Bradyrhizobium canariense]